MGGTGLGLAIVKHIVERHRAGQPVLVGTTSVEKSEYLSRLLAKRGFDIPEDVLNRDREERWEKSDAVEAAWVTIYQNPHDHWDLYELAEKLVDLEYHFQRWRFGHLKTVERIIGFKKGTGGTSGVGYLEGVLKEVFFPELLSVRTAL